MNPSTLIQEVVLYSSEVILFCFGLNFTDVKLKLVQIFNLCQNQKITPLSKKTMDIVDIVLVLSKFFHPPQQIRDKYSNIILTHYLDNCIVIHRYI